MCHKLLPMTIRKLNSTLSTINGISGLCAFQFWNQSAFEKRCFSFVSVIQGSAELCLYFIVPLQSDCYRNWNMAVRTVIIWSNWIRNFTFIDINISISTAGWPAGWRFLPCCQIKCVNSILWNCKEGTIKMIAIIVFSRSPFNLKNILVMKTLKMIKPGFKPTLP